MKIPINRLKTCPINSEIYRDSDVGDLVNSIGEVGLLQPIVVTPDNTIISGHRRFKSIQSLGWTEVEVEVKEVEEDSIPLYIVFFNQSRNKVASELIREIMVLMDSRWIGQGKWNRGKSDQMITFGNWRDKVSKDIGISQTKIQKLLYIYQNQPELIKYIDDDRWAGLMYLMGLGVGWENFPIQKYLRKVKKLKSFLPQKFSAYPELK